MAATQIPQTHLQESSEPIKLYGGLSKKTWIIIGVVIGVLLLILIITLSVMSSQSKEETVKTDKCGRQEGNIWYGDQYPCFGTKDPKCPYRIFPPPPDKYNEWTMDDWGSDLCVARYGINQGSDTNRYYYTDIDGKTIVNQAEIPLNHEKRCTGQNVKEWDDEAVYGENGTGLEDNLLKWNTTCPCDRGQVDKECRICGTQGSNFWGVEPNYQSGYESGINLLNGVIYSVYFYSNNANIGNRKLISMMTRHYSDRQIHAKSRCSCTRRFLYKRCWKW